MILKFREKVKSLYYSLILGRENPERIARGIAIGVFVAMSPFLGIHTVLCILFAIVLRGSKTAAVLGSLFCNPISLPLIFFIDYEAGLFVLKAFKMNYSHMILSDFKDFKILQQGLELFVPIVVGSIFLGTIFSIISYYFSKKYFTKIFNEKNS